jgi:biotin carboxylase
LGSHLGARTAPLDVAVNFRDKSVQKSIVTAAGVPTAAFECIPDILDVPKDFELPFSPAVLKPVGGAATSLTSVVCTTADIHARSAEYLRAGVPARSFIVEEFSAGQEWFADGLVVDGKVAFVALGRYLETCLDTVQANLPLQLVQLDPVTEKTCYELAEPVIQQALTALGLRSGPFHMELFADLDAGRVAFGECAARRGGVLTRDAVLIKFGVDLARAGVQALAGDEPDFQVRHEPAVIGSTFLPCTPGVLADHPSAAEIAALPGVLYAQVELPQGFAMPHEIGNAVAKFGQALIAAGSHEELLQRMSDVTAWVSERTRALNSDLPPRLLRRDIVDPMWSRLSTVA